MFGQTGIWAFLVFDLIGGPPGPFEPLSDESIGSRSMSGSEDANPLENQIVLSHIK